MKQRLEREQAKPRRWGMAGSKVGSLQDDSLAGKLDKEEAAVLNDATWYPGIYRWEWWCIDRESSWQVYQKSGERGGKLSLMSMDHLPTCRFHSNLGLP